MGGGASTGGSYVERLTAPAALWAGVVVFALALGLSFYAALGPVAGLVAVLLPGITLSVLLARTTTEVRVESGTLRAGAAQIPVRCLGPARALDAEQSRQVRGPQSDPAGFHLIRGWVPAGVQAEVVDPHDPTPYWFVASRDPVALAAAIEGAREDVSPRTAGP